MISIIFKFLTPLTIIFPFRIYEHLLDKTMDVIICYASHIFTRAQEYFTNLENVVL